MSPAQTPGSTMEMPNKALPRTPRAAAHLWGVGYPKLALIRKGAHQWETKYWHRTNARVPKMAPNRKRLHMLRSNVALEPPPTALSVAARAHNCLALAAQPDWLSRPLPALVSCLWH